MKLNRALPIFSILLIVALATLSCASSDLFFMKVDSDATQTAIAQRTIAQGLLDFESTLNARQLTQEAQFAAKQAEGKKQRAQQTVVAQQTIDASPPEILSVDFPSEVPGDHSYVVCKIKFHDPGADVHMVYFEPVMGKYKSFGVDASSEPASKFTGGTFEIGLWCEGQQDVTLSVYLSDRGGHKSNTMTFSFTCK